MAREANRWKKILYEKQGYPDNYVDSSFHDELQKNLNVKPYKFSTLVWESSTITHQLASVCSLVILFFYMEAHLISPQWLWVLASVMTLIGYVVYTFLTWRLDHSLSLLRCNNLFRDMKTCLFFQGFSAALSPILVSLMETISTDTIYAITSVMLLANLLFCNYHSSSDPVPGALSLNAAVFASVCFASRLHTPWHAFSTVTTAFELFALWPVLRRKVKEWNGTCHLLLSILVTLTCAIAMSVVSLVGTVLYLLVAVFVNLIAPAWLIHLQPLKDNIHGPWDEAVVKQD